MSTVVIPHDHFLKRVRNEYSDHKTAFIREVIQNPLDAGANRIDFVTRDNGLTVTDNGDGILPEILEKALFTLGGTYKNDTNSVGGFGCAKEIILFAHPEYRVETLTSVVTGGGAEYDISKREESFPGMRIDVTFSNGWNYSKSRFENDLITFVRRSRIKAKLFLNNVELEQSDAARKAPLQPQNIGTLYLLPNDPERLEYHYVSVRCNGLLMFQKSISFGRSKYKVILDIASSGKPSTEILTQNRDSFRYDYQAEFFEMTNAFVTSDSALDRKSRLWVFNTPKKVIETSSQIEQMEPVTQGASFEVEAVASVPPPSPKRKKPRTSGEMIFLEQKIFSRPFIIDLVDSPHKSPPKKSLPDSISAKNLWLLKAWSWMISFVCENAGCPAAWGFGFTFGSSELGYHSKPFSKREGHPLRDTSFLLINPIVLDEYPSSKDKRKLLSKIYSIACHEHAHMSREHHDEGFAKELTYNISVTAGLLPPLGKMLREIAKTKP